MKRNEQQYGIPLKILSYQELYGWTMDDIVRAIGHKNNCTFCGVFRRQALDRGAALLEADKMATGRLITLPQLSSGLTAYKAQPEAGKMAMGGLIPWLEAGMLFRMSFQVSLRVGHVKDQDNDQGKLER